MDNFNVTNNVMDTVEDGEQTAQPQPQAAPRRIAGQAPRFAARVAEPTDFNFDVNMVPQVFDQRDELVDVPVDKGVKAAAKPHTFALK